MKTAQKWVTAVKNPSQSLWVRRIFVTALLALPLAAGAEAFEMILLPKSADLAKLPPLPRCVPGTRLDFTRPGKWEPAEVGGWVIVLGMGDARANGLYRIAYYASTAYQDPRGGGATAITAFCENRP